MESKPFKGIGYRCSSMKSKHQAEFDRKHKETLRRNSTRNTDMEPPTEKHGDESLPYETNQVIFEAVYKYIQNSKRF